MARTVKLNTGAEMPTIALGTWKSPVGQTGQAVKAAIRAGYRNIDCANDYGNEAEIGATLKELFESGEIKREELFIQCKLYNANHRKDHVKPDLMASLEDLQLDYVDSFVIHWPQACPSTGEAPAYNKHGAHPGPRGSGVMFPLEEDGRYCSDNESHYIETWHAMEDLVDEGLCKSIGLSNFNGRQIREILQNVTRHRPAVLQNECHPYLQNKDLMDLCRIEGIVFQSYSPLGSYDRPWAQQGLPSTGHELLKDPKLLEMSERYGKSPAQIVLRWHVQRGSCAAPKSVTHSRIAENIGIYDFELSPGDMDLFSLLNCGWRHCMFAESAMHPDYPFKDDLPYGYVPGPAPKSTTTSGR
jgi:diketogulonate reductase-like aldo/keto reductase|eukprot:CAMPEP_0174289178 /NCGR_PEP_ID=MMETSP0809-20121228/23957_1 /TAXON_ID=73025 ORGANISM="Eutreptiella gymnastica-like, Strain CCMP1594" /NCGR_SAMPLE_ID=MMETSP0809 /ASSEMBLY_ACC=CAM_ASM_000658 /LENGTH=356 /DNA_ID=CAMNT_0015386965 /DNA_START=28 /DNA_END=1098 /DNA_ORIENTATION=+